MRCIPYTQFCGRGSLRKSHALRHMHTHTRFFLPCLHGLARGLLCTQTTLVWEALLCRLQGHRYSSWLRCRQQLHYSQTQPLWQVPKVTCSYKELLHLECFIIVVAEKQRRPVLFLQTHTYSPVGLPFLPASLFCPCPSLVLNPQELT